MLTDLIKKIFLGADSSGGGGADGLEPQLVLKETPTRDVTPDSSSRRHPTFTQKTGLQPLGRCPYDADLVKALHSSLVPGGSYSATKEERLQAIRAACKIWLLDYGRELRGETGENLSLTQAASQAALLLDLGDKSVRSWFAEALQTGGLED
jgi:hypothetical protein